MSIWTKNGKIIVDDSGSIIDCTVCPCKCRDDCEEFVIARYVTNADDSSRRCWDLTPYKYIGKYACDAWWHLYEAGYPLSHGRGRIGWDGELIGLPDKYCSPYHYDGYMVLKQVCWDGSGSFDPLKKETDLSPWR